MAKINAKTTGGGGVETIADSTGVLELQSAGTTMATISPSGFNLGGGTPSIATALSPYTGFKNRIINGAMVIDQRNAGASVTTIAGAANFALDRWRSSVSQSSKFSMQQNAGAVTPPAGFTNYLGCTSLSAYTVGASDNFDIRQNIEGFNVTDLSWGTASASPVTLSFWVRSSLTGAFGGGLKNSASNRSYPFSYTISSANTWEQKTITIAGDTTGTWLTDNGTGVTLTFGLGVGSTLSGTAGAWAAGNFLSATGATSVVGTSGATFYITGVQLEVGTNATSFEFRDIGRELMMCQRYYWKHSGSGVNFNGIANGGFSTTTTRVNSTMIRYPVTMRALGSASYSGGGFYDGNNVVATSGAFLYQAYSLNSFSFDLGSAALISGRTTSFGFTNTNEFFDVSAEL
jgi:hypothetical protein